MISIISDDDLIAIVEEICESIIATDAGDHADDPGPASTPGGLTASVAINGDWTGTVSITCRRNVAERIASVMFHAPVPDLSREDVIDALGEVANMAAGAIKGMLDGEKTLGLPTVGEAADDQAPEPDEVQGVDYPFADGTVRLAIHQSSAP